MAQSARGCTVLSGEGALGAVGGSPGPKPGIVNAVRSRVHTEGRV